MDVIYKSNCFSEMLPPFAELQGEESLVLTDTEILNCVSMTGEATDGKSLW